ncbi:TonB-dependent siderophore receptor [Roseateles sp.]|uniref:TonB-dependent receptor n=1 Tax=Roseateles sp. TaxID=1971397 RepID=UPI002F42B1CB
MTKKLLGVPSHARTVRQLRPVAAAAALSVLAIGLTTSAHAQSSSDVTLPSVSIKGKAESGYQAKRATTATKTDTALLDTPQSISVVTERDVQDRAAQGVGEAARYVPGVGFAQGEGNRETPIFRGISTTGDFFIDGIRDDVQYYRDLYNIERMEVFKGPNAMIFGRGATGGLINRVSKVAQWDKFVAGSVTLGSYQNRRVTIDGNSAINDSVAVRLNALHEDSESYRDGVNLKRSGVNPTLAWRSGGTRVDVGYEYFKDDRIADRGISSFQGKPVDTDPKTFFGNAEGSPTWSKLNAFNLAVEHDFGNGTTLKNRTRVADQDKFYQNVFAGAVNAAGTQVAIAAYNNATQRKSWFNQTDLSFKLDTGGIRHTVLTGLELGKQDTDNFRNTGFFAGGATSVNVPLSNPVTTAPITFSQSATDANNSSTAKVAAIYVQDQVEFTKQFLLIAGLRYDSFKVDFTNNRNAQQINTSDSLVSPRVGVIFKPFDAMSLYANYSIAHQPRAGDQLSSLSVTNAALDPEKFKSYELGAKWDINPAFSATAAVYRLDRTNVIVLDPTDPTNTRTMLSDGQRSDGFELGLAGNVTSAWSVTGGYSYIDAKFLADTSATLRSGATVGQVPKHTFTLWNRYDFTQDIGAGLGLIHRSKMFASNELIATSSTPIPNVELPAYTRIDAAVFYRLNETMRLQLNVENLFDRKYYAFANSNTNITPGSPRAFRVSLNARF